MAGDHHSRLIENLASVRERMRLAAQRGGRSATEISLVAVTKYVSIEVARSLVEAGCRDLGESRPQELWHKAQQLADCNVRWHLIGHLQRNKARRVLPHVGLIHSIDSVRLLEAINDEAQSLENPVPALLEVNCSGDATKHGFFAGDLPAIVQSLDHYPRVRLCGLMTMAAREGDLQTARENFRQLRDLRNRLQSEAPPGVDLAELSMGMSGDYEIAIEEGATLIRVGSALFEGIDPSNN